jgi:uncharacterized membrane protein
MVALAQDRTILKHRTHWHVLLVHFPITLFFAAFGFQILHLVAAPACFELATNVTLAAGTIMMIPTTRSGWRSWMRDYKGAKVMLFKRKIAIAFFMLGLGIALTVWRFLSLGIFSEAKENPQHLIYLAGNALLMMGAVAEGYYGGRLNHR